MTTEPESFRELWEALDRTLGITADESALGIVSVWADRDGRALVWRRVGAATVCEEQRFRPWVFAATLEDLAHVGRALQPADAPGAERAPFSYRELDGEPGTYRYLIAARSGRALERALLAGAARRLGWSPASLYDLDQDYYRVGPVEQYLMSSGRVYFRGLTFGDLRRMQIDLETTALSASRGRIFMAAVRDTGGLEVVLEAPRAEDEAQLIADLCALVRERDPDVIENHNLFGFDMPFLVERAAALGVPLALGRPEGPPEPVRYEDAAWAGPRARRRVRYSVAGRELIDTLDAVRRHDFVTRELPSYGLKDVARVFGIAAPDRVYIPGSEVLATYRRDPELVRRYALADVAEVDALSQRLMGAPFALAGMAPRRFERLASAGPAMGILEPMLVRAYLRAGAALPRQQPGADGDLGPHSGGALFLFAEGIAEHVVKADIASLYPSLMRVHRIGPASDRLGVLLDIVGRLTDLRLHHKAAARRAARGSAEFAHHDAMQAAMKVLINSAYGYMGAGSMALFADRAAADEVTRRGREVLGKVVEELRARGVALIEADTDGVYFAVPADWDEARERALVAEVAATLDDGIRLEYEGRYAAMLSHEVKNYALLTYDGRLIVRGVALRSSRAEPFGERFLHRALRCAMTGDIAGLRAAYLETVAALRSRALPVEDVAQRARLSKTPEEYAASRSSLREGPYEALLAAGRTEWAVGERVRCYKAQDGSYVWVPDESDEPTVGVVRSTSDADAPADDDGRPRVPAPRRANDYDVEHYLDVLLNSYASRLKKAFDPADFDQIFRRDAQLGMFDTPVEEIQPRWIRAGASGSP
ncbi:MAG: DNA polymerase domain-containing protein [Chloroflexota bacterium]